MAPSRPQQMTGVSQIELSHVVLKLIVLSCTKFQDLHRHNRGTTLAVAHPLEQSSKAAVPALISRETVRGLEVSPHTQHCTYPQGQYSWPDQAVTFASA